MYFTNKAFCDSRFFEHSSSYMCIWLFSIVLNHRDSFYFRGENHQKVSGEWKTFDKYNVLMRIIDELKTTVSDYIEEDIKSHLSK